MPANKNAVTRYKVLDELLSDKYHYYNIHELTEKINDRLDEYGYKLVSSRMIEKDIEYLSERPFCANIQRFRHEGKRCIKYEDPSFSIFTKELSEDEKILLHEVLSTIGQFDGLDNFDWLDGLKQRLKDSESNQKKIIFFANNPDLENSNLLGRLFSSISNKVALKMIYKPFELEKETFLFYPYALKQYNGRWFVFGRKDETDRIYNLAIDRIRKIEPKPNAAYIDSDFNLEDHIFDVVGVSIPFDAEIDDILLWVSDKSYNYVRSKPLHPTQKEVKGTADLKLRDNYPQLNGGRFIRLRCIVNYELKQTIASMLGEMIVLEPVILRDEMERCIIAQSEKYKAIRKKDA